MVTPDHHDPKMHSREMHSLKVALVAKEIAEDVLRNAKSDARLAELISNYGGLDAIVCEVAGLAHDLGHPPFGHVGEQLLDQFVRYVGPFTEGRADDWEPGARDAIPSKEQRLATAEARELCKVSPTLSQGFEGNAQTFRVVSRLAQHKFVGGPFAADGATSLQSPSGLDLSAASLAAVLKYPWWRVDGSATYQKKYGVYPDDLEAFVFARAWLPPAIGPQRQSLEASIMDLADDITYAVHDLQDFSIAGLLNPGAVSRILRRQLDEMLTPGYVDAARATPHEMQETESAETGRGGATALEQAYRKLARHHKGFLNRDTFIEALGEVDELFNIQLGSGRHSGAWFDDQIRSVFSELVGVLLGSITVHEAEAWPEGPFVYPDPLSWHIIQVCKTIAKKLVIESPPVGVVQRTQRTSLTRLLLDLNQWLLSSPAVDELPDPLRTFVLEGNPSGGETVVHRGQETRRQVVDFVCSLTDVQALRWSTWLDGNTMPGLREVN